MSVSVSASRGEEDGFSLIEVLLAGIIGSIVIGAIASTLILALRTTEDTATRMSVTFNAQLVSNYLLPDVQSAGAGAGDLAAAPAPDGQPECTVTTPSGTAVLTATWRETQQFPGGNLTSTFESVYRVTSDRLLVRTHRLNGATSSADVLARSVDWAEAQISGDRVTLCVQVAGGYAATVSGYRRSASEASSAEPPAPALPACSVETATVDPNPANRSTIGVLFGAAPRLTVVTTGTRCANVRVVYETSSGSPPLVPPVVIDSLLTRSGDTWQTNLVTTGWDDRGDFELGLFWSDTPASVRNPLGTVDFRVDTSEPCVVTSLETSPTTGTRDRNPSPQVLTQGSVTVTANANATCAALTLRYDAASEAANPTAKALAFSKTSGTTWQAVIPAGEVWSDGRHPLQVLEGAGSTLGLTALNSVDFNVTPRPCAVTGAVVSPSAVGRNQVGRDGLGGLRQSVTVTANVSGVCAGLEIRFTPNAAPVTEPMTAAADHRTWSFVIQGNAHQWSAGKKTLDVLLNGQVVQSVDLEVS